MTALEFRPDSGTRTEPTTAMRAVQVILAQYCSSIFFRRSDSAKQTNVVARRGALDRIVVCTWSSRITAARTTVQ